jgi:general secretion pathway protein G
VKPACLSPPLAARKAGKPAGYRIVADSTQNPLPAVPRNGAESGFTLLELLVVIAILGLLAALVGPRLFSVLGTAKTKLTHQQIENIGSALDMYKLDVGAYPTSDQGLLALVSKPNDVENWNGPYTKSDGVPKDPWNHPWTYHNPSSRQGHDYDLCSGGASGQSAEPGSPDAICNP